MLQRAVSLDPRFADAYAEMAFERMWHLTDTLNPGTNTGTSRTSA